MVSCVPFGKCRARHKKKEQERYPERFWLRSPIRVFVVFGVIRFRRSHVFISLYHKYIRKQRRQTQKRKTPQSTMSNVVILPLLFDACYSYVDLSHSEDARAFFFFEREHGVLVRVFDCSRDEVVSRDSFWACLLDAL